MAIWPGLGPCTRRRWPPVRSCSAPATLTSANNLAETLLAQGDLAGARALQKETLAACREVLGPRHPDVSVSAWNLYTTLRELDPTAAQVLLEHDLGWLVDADPGALGSDQREVRVRVRRELGH